MVVLAQPHLSLAPVLLTLAVVGAVETLAALALVVLVEAEPEEMAQTELLVPPIQAVAVVAGLDVAAAINLAQQAAPASSF